MATPGPAAMLKSPVKNWHSILVPAGLCAFVAGLAAIPYVLSARNGGTFGEFISAYDESTYLLGDVAVQYRMLSDGVVEGIGHLAPGPGGVLLVTDLLLPVLVTLAAWALVTRCLASTPLRLLAVLALLFGGDLFSLANSIVWPSQPIADLRASEPPLSLELIPDATTSYFSLFRTPEPQVSWAILLGFLALVAGPDPLRAFEGSRRWLSLPIFAVLPIIYTLTSVPILVIAAALLVHATFLARDRARGVAVALAVTVVSWIAITILTGGDGEGATSRALFDSRLPSLAPAMLLGLSIAAFLLVVHRLEIVRRAELVVTFVAAMLPMAVTNQQVITGFMVSTRDWERNSSYILIAFSLISLIGMRERDATRVPSALRWLALVTTVILAGGLVAWQRDVYNAWSPTNVQSRESADLLERLPEDLDGVPIVMQNVGLVPPVRLLTDDRYEFILDYTRLFGEEGIPAFADGWEDSEARASSQERIFEYWFRLGRSPAAVERELSGELSDIGVPGFYSHFLFSFRDVWPPMTDWRALNREVALEEVPAIVDAYSRFVRMRERSEPSPAILITDGPPEDPGDGRSFELLGSADGGGATATQIYLESFPADGVASP